MEVWNEGVASLRWDSPAVAWFLVALAIAVWWLTRDSKYDLDKIPGPWTEGYPLLGNIPELLTPNFHRKLLSWANKYGGIYRVKYLWKDAVVVTDPEAVAAIMGRGPGALDKSAATYGSVNEMVTPHGHPNLLTSASDATWKAVRKAIAVSFSLGNVKPKYDMVLSKINELLERLKALGPEESVDVDQAALRVTLDVIGLSAFSHDYECVKQDTPSRDHLLRVLPRCFTEVELRLANPFRSIPSFPRKWFKNGEKGQKSFEHFQKEMRALLKEMKLRGPPAKDDFSIAAQLMRLRDDMGICDERILSEIGILFVEGFETTGHTVSWTLFCLATNPEAQRRVAEELDAAGLLSKPSHKARELEYQDLNKLKYLTCCIKEAMRMYPVVSVGNGRVTQKPTQVGKYTIPGDVLVAAPLYALQNSRHNWKNPSQFKPERWMDVPVETFVTGTNKEKPSQSITFMPFSYGPRSCVGQSLAKMEVMALLAKLLGTFHFALAPEMGGVAGVTKRESTHLTLQTKGTQGIRMHLQPRNQLPAGAKTKKRRRRRRWRRA